MEHSGLFHARFRDDWIILAPTRWNLRETVRTVNQVLAVPNIVKHPGRTFIGKLSRDFDFLRYHFCRDGSQCLHPLSMFNRMSYPALWARR
jgi:hypothetical protein